MKGNARKTANGAAKFGMEPFDIHAALLQVSLTTRRGSLSSRSAMNLVCRSLSAPVHSAKSIRTTVSRLDPDAALHFVGGQPLTPSARLFLGQIGKRTLHPFVRFEPGENLAPARGDEARTHPAGKHQVLAPIETDNQRIEGIAGGVAADHELLSQVDPVLAPLSGPLPGLVAAVGALRDDALQVVFLDECEHPGGGVSDHRETDVRIARQDPGKNRAALSEGTLREKPSLVHEHVERVVMDLGFGRFEVLQQVEVGAPALIQGDELAVDNGLFG